MLGHGAIGQFAIGQDSAFTIEIVSIDKWFESLSDPIRVKLGLSPTLQQFSALSDPFPFVPFAWFGWLRDPTSLVKRGLPTPEQPFLAFYPTPSPFAASGWYGWLSEPVRIKPGQPVYLQREFTIDSRIPPEFPQLYRWFKWFDEPKRFKQGLSATLQQTLAYHPRWLPKPNITATLSAFEINSDAATIAVNVVQSQPAASAKVSIVEVFSGNSATSVREIGWY